MARTIVPKLRIYKMELSWKPEELNSKNSVKIKI
jgi:hypothetical protein